LFLFEYCIVFPSVLQFVAHKVLRTLYTLDNHLKSHWFSYEDANSESQ